MTVWAEGETMAGISHARSRPHTGVIAVLFIAFFVVLAVATLVVTIRDSGSSPSTPTPVVQGVAVERTIETCAWHRNGWYC